MSEVHWNKNVYLKWGITLIFALVGLFCMLKSYGYCEEYRIPIHQEYLFKNLECRGNWQAKPGRGNAAPSANQRQQWQDAYDDHHFNAVRTYNDAYNRVWYLPDLTWRQIGRDAWVAACGTAGGNTVCGRLVIAFSTMLSNYGLHCLDEWEYIQDKLYWSNYHFEKCAEYANKLHGR